MKTLQTGLLSPIYFLIFQWIWYLTWIHFDDNTEWSKVSTLLDFTFQSTNKVYLASCPCICNLSVIWHGWNWYPSWTRLEEIQRGRRLIMENSWEAELYRLFHCFQLRRLWKQERSQHNVYMRVWSSFTWLDSPFPPSLHLFPTQTRINFQTQLPNINSIMTCRLIHTQSVF